MGGLKKRMNEQTANSKSSETKPYYESEVLTERAAIVKKLNGVCNQLLQWGLAHNVGDVRRAHFFRAAIYASSVQLQALKDKEIDQLMMEIESIKKHVGMVKDEKQPNIH